MDQDAFVASGLNYDATLRNLELIGEAATHIPNEVRQANSQIPWRMIIATRNRLIHSYLGIDNDTLWSIIRDDIPALLAQLRNLDLDARGRLITQDIVPQIEERLKFLEHVGLGYLSLDRPTETLSGRSEEHTSELQSH